MVAHKKNDVGKEIANPLPPRFFLTSFLLPLVIREPGKKICI